MGFQISGSAGPALLAIVMAGPLQPMLDLKAFTSRHQLDLVIPGLDASETFGMHLIDGDMQMQMSRIGMNGREALMTPSPIAAHSVSSISANCSGGGRSPGGKDTTR